MSGVKSDPYGPDRWLPLMGNDLPKARSQPIHPVTIREGRVGLFSHGVKHRFPVGTRIELQLRSSRLLVVEAEGGIPVQEPHFWDSRDPILELDLPRGALEAIGCEEPFFGMLLHGTDGLELLPIRVEEHEPDVFGPRIIDELKRPQDGAQPPEIVRHVVRGLAYEEWTPEGIRGVEDLLCWTPFRHDPLNPLTEGDDWVAWRVRRHILSQPGGEDEHRREEFVRQTFTDQGEDGSWSDSPLRTAYGILHALSLDVSLQDPRMQRAAQWLLSWPEPAGRPGMWMLSQSHLRDWEAGKSEEGERKDSSFPIGSPDESAGFVREEAQQQVLPTCARHFSGLCDAMLHVSAAAAYALCRCGYPDHPRLKSYADSMLQLAAMFGYFCACWGILDFSREISSLEAGGPDFDRSARQRDIALRSIPYGYGRDRDDLRFLARFPQCPGMHRPDLADTDGWWPYEWKDIGFRDHFAVLGSYWENADCWAKANRALAQFPAYRGSTTEFFALFQCHLYQTSLGEWNQGFPAGILQWISEVTRAARSECAIDESPLLRFAKVMVLKTVPWLREHQDEDGMWDHTGLSREGEGAGFPAMSARLTTYHIVTALMDFGLLERLRPPA
jgi:hypothetical protein